LTVFLCVADDIHGAHDQLYDDGHHRVDAEIDGVGCIGLNKVARPGNLVAVEIG
jgi:hypothetical protein